MRSLGLIFLGLLLLSGGIGVLGWRVHNNPGILERYEHALTGNPNQTIPKVPGSEQRDDGSGGNIVSGPTENERQTQHVGSLKMIEILLDLANVIVGLIGIWLAVSGMRTRSQARAA